jgi:site-specific recombinase XerD
MSRVPFGLFTHVQSYFTEYLPKQRGASIHTIRAYRDALTMLFKFVAEQRGRGVAALQLSDIDADVVMRFLDHIEAQRIRQQHAIAAGRRSAASSSTSCATTWRTHSSACGC